MHGRAWLAIGGSQLRLGTVPAPAPGPYEVRVRVTCVGLNRRDVDALHGGIPAPGIPASDAVGVVESCGDHAGLRPGSRVLTCFHASGWEDGPIPAGQERQIRAAGAPGVLAETITVPAAGVVELPDALADADATWLPTAALTAWNAVVEAGELRRGERLLLGGGGAVACAATVIARSQGVVVVAAAGSSAAALAAAGAQVIDRRQPQWWSGLEPCDAVIALGVPLPELQLAVRPHGRLLLVSQRSGAPDTTRLLLRQQRLIGIHVGPRAMLRRLVVEAAAGRLRFPPPRIWDFTDAPAAFAAVSGGELRAAIRTAG